MVCSHIVAIIRYISMRDTKSSKSFGVRDWGQYLAEANDLPKTNPTQIQ